MLQARVSSPRSCLWSEGTTRLLEEGKADKDNTDKLKRDNVGDDVTGEFFSLRLEAKDSDDKPIDDKVGNE